MSESIAVLNQKVDDLGEDVSNINNELKTMNSSLSDLIRIDGNILRLEEKLNRIGTEKDDHEDRIRALESKSGRLFERILGYAISVSVGGVCTFLLMKGLT